MKSAENKSDIYTKNTSAEVFKVHQEDVVAPREFVEQAKVLHEIVVPWESDAVHPESHCSGGGVLDGPNCDQSVHHPC